MELGDRLGLFGAVSSRHRVRQLYLSISLICILMREQWALTSFLRHDPSQPENEAAATFERQVMPFDPDF